MCDGCWGAASGGLTPGGMGPSQDLGKQPEEEKPVQENWRRGGKEREQRVSKGVCCSQGVSVGA